jgi:hypothetical protein
MNPNAIHRRLARLQRECNVSAIPVLLLSATCAVLVLVLALQAGTASAQPAHSAEDTRTFDAAMVAYERNHWDAAYAAFTTLADRGHPEAARMAAQMWRHGPALYHTSFAASAQQVERWSRSWGCAGEAAGRACLHALRAP